MSQDRHLVDRALTFATVLALCMIALAGWYSWALSSPDWCQQLLVAEATAEQLEDDTLLHDHRSGDVSDLCANLLGAQIDWMGWANIAIVLVCGFSIIGIYFIKVGGGGLQFEVGRDGRVKLRAQKSDDLTEGYEAPGYEEPMDLRGYEESEGTER